MEIGGLPLHMLVVHAAVVLTPIAALAAVVFAAVPRWRWLTRWPTLVAVLVSLGSVVTARFSGHAFLNAHPELAPLVKVHQQRGDLLMWITIGFALVVIVAAWLLPSATPLPSGKGARESALSGADKLVAAVVVLTALAVLVQVVLTGDAGSRAVWG